MVDEHTLIREALQTLTGVKIDPDKIYLIETRLKDILSEYSLSSFDQMAQKIKEGTDQNFLNRVTEKITTHETRFFRDESIFDALVVQIIPEWLEKRGISRMNLEGERLDIWSAACSTGQEPYSIMMMLHEKMPDIAAITRILGTDISQETLDKAKKGVFTKFEVDRGLPEPILNKYFTNEGTGFKCSDKISSHIQFQKHNLVSDPFPGPFDIVFLRNVAIYFDDNVKKEIYSKIKKITKPDGILVLGSSENLSGYMTDFILREFGLARYYEINSSQVTIFKQ
ncbi:MAG: protein-glutamate O-methyltransferase CheR [Spirochaetia bacterium]|nr:protein-glutamate O-methyltransferase CheR [Spirochaetia bacterium]